MAVARLARPGEEGAVAGVLAAAFAEDPTFNWLFQAEDTRPMFVTTWMRGAAESAIASGTCWVAVEGDEIVASAIWSAPGQPSMSPEITERLRAMLFGVNGPRTAEVGAFFGEVFGQHPEEPHWYLSILGASTRGQGHGQVAIEPVLRICDAAGELAWLESSNPRNIGFYERLGFETSVDLRPDGGGPLLTCMGRTPR